MKNPVKVAVGLSGGVDSALAAALLKKEGFDVVGITMEIWDGAIEVSETARHACYGPGEEEDVELSRQVCAQLDIPYHVFDLRKEYEATVLDYFRKEYLAGRTPNPCVVCNHRLKFGFLIDKARESGLEFDFFATGHYARVQKKEGEFFLVRAEDKAKDQTYFLNGLPREQLSEVLFPLGNYTKQQVREVAREFGLGVAERAESQDFISGASYDALFDPKDIKPGEIVNESGEIVGAHTGIIHYTVGQRKGLGLTSAKPLYVLRLDSKNNRVVVTDRDNLFSDGLYATDLNLLGTDHIESGKRVTAKIRQSQTEAPGRIFAEPEGLRIEFDTPQRSVTPGQSLVLYDGDVVYAGGIIDRPLKL
jgi:tRNA-specific 2-thiouridylase